MVDNHRLTVSQEHFLAAVEPADEVNGRGRVMEDLNGRWRSGQQRPVEPLEVFAHDAPGQEVMGFNRFTGAIDDATVAHPPVPLRYRPVEQADRVAGLIILTGEWIKAELATRSVEQQVVGLSDVVDAGAGRPGLDHMDLGLQGQTKDHDEPL